MIVETFLTAKKISPDASMLSEDEDAQCATVFNDQELEEEFVEYHHKVSEGRLRVVAARANTSAGSQYRIRNAQCPVQLSLY